MPPELEAVIPRPVEMFYLWDWLGELISPLSFVELGYWQELTGRRLATWEVRALIELDKVRSYG